MKSHIEQREMDLSYTYQTTDIAVELHTEDELVDLVDALQNDDNIVVLMHDHHRNILVHFYVRFRERM